MRPPKIKNKAPAPTQVTSEQILKDAEIHRMQEFKPAQQRIMDEEELEDYKLSKRKEFEDKVRRQSHHIGNWIRYA